MAIRVDISVLCHGDRLDIGPFSFRVETNLTFELSRTAPIAETRVDLVDNVDTITSSESEATTDTEPKTAPPPAAPPDAEAEPETEETGDKPITVEFLKKLMLQGVLTRFQSDWILEGKFEEFNVDEFRIVDILGTGGMGWLYVAVNETTGEKAAVKVISKHMDNDYLTRFKLEARAGLMLNHPNHRSHAEARRDRRDLVRGHGAGRGDQHAGADRATRLYSLAAGVQPGGAGRRRIAARSRKGHGPPRYQARAICSSRRTAPSRCSTSAWL